MRWTWMSVLAIGVGVVALGTLWFLQGSDVVHIEPVLCVGECEPVVGHHPEWQLAGVGAVVAGGLATGLAVRKLRR